MGKSVAFGATLPGAGYTLSSVFLGEMITTFTLVALLCVFLGFRKIRPITPGIFPPLYAIMVWAESPISGTSTNPGPQPGTCNRLGTMGGLVDLLDRADGRDAFGRAGLQFPCEKNHGGEVVPLRQRPRQVVSQDEPSGIPGASDWLGEAIRISL
jgi:hypothetical protein